MTETVPSVIAMLLCDTVIVDAQTGKKTLVGIFDSFNFGQFPATISGFSFFARMTDMQGKYQFRINIVNLEEDKTIVSMVTNEAEPPEKFRYVDLSITVPNVVFDRPAIYEFQLFANEIYIGRVLVDVRNMEAT